ncbi:hypothetical protein F5883DRAFT_396677, partial [Diaporthe sp. PMI_573]
SCSHFYLVDSSAWALVLALYNKGFDYTKEDLCQHAWHDIIRTYFPARQTAQATVYHVITQAYRGLPPHLNQRAKPDVITVKVNRILPGLVTALCKRDIFWVECKAPSKDQPNEWSTVMNEAVSRLEIAHSGRALYIILNVGLEWLPFYWDPNNPAGPGMNLTIKAARGHSNFPVSPKIRPPPGINAGHID